MKLAEYLEDLDPKLAANLERALDAVRGEFEEKIADTVQEAVSAAAAQAQAQAREQERISAVAASEQPAPPPLALDAADELRLAALDIDTASSQAEILETLTRGVLRFSSRVAIFVNRGQEVHGWSASGFGSGDATIRDVSLSTELPFPIGARLTEGAVALSAEDCGLICDAIGATRPSMGILLPFVLGSQVVGTVYCDRHENDVFSVSALQLLTYIAGQTLETLPVRKRESTATLSLARGSATPAPATQAPPPSEEADEAATETLETGVEHEPEAEPETVASEPQAASEAATEVQIDAPEPPPGELSTEPDHGAEEPAPSALEGAPEPLAAIDEEGTRPGTLGLAPIPDASPAPAAPPPVAGTDESLGTTVEPAVNLSSTQVAPPADLQGPGWAFTGGSEASEATSESEHEEAQRLARLLVTEIKLYNEEAVEQGRRDGDVYSRLQEDIDRSRQIFEDRIDPDIRSENDYFKQALVRILAGGDPTLLGI